jgi:hypothetical protein
VDFLEQPDPDKAACSKCVQLLCRHKNAQAAKEATASLCKSPKSNCCNKQPRCVLREPAHYADGIGELMRFLRKCNRNANPNLKHNSTTASGLTADSLKVQDGMASCRAHRASLMEHAPLGTTSACTFETHHTSTPHETFKLAPSTCKSLDYMS